MTPFQKETFQIQSFCHTVLCGYYFAQFLVLLFPSSLDTNWCACNPLLWVTSFYVMKVTSPVLPLTAMGEIQIPGDH